MKRVIKVLVLLVFFCLCVPLVAQTGKKESVLGDLGLKCSSSYLRNQIKNILVAAKKNGMLVVRFSNRIREGVLKKASCVLLLRVLRREYRYQKMGQRILVAAGCYSQESHALLTNLFYLGLRASIIRQLIAAYKYKRNQRSLATAGYFVFYMKNVGWRAFVVLPLGQLVLRTGLRHDTVEGVKQLLLFSRDLKISRRKAVGIILKGLKKKKSIRRIRHELKELRVF